MHGVASSPAPRATSWSYFATIATCELQSRRATSSASAIRLCGLPAEAEAGTCEGPDVHEEWPWPTG